jgi:hypothetical protein
MGGEKMRYTLIVFALAALSAGASAQVLMDQIGANPADLNGVASASQDFETSNNGFDIGAIDDFTIASSKNIVKVEAVLFGFNGFTSYSAVTNYRVEFYSSVAAGAGNLVGNVASQIVGPGSVTLNTTYVTGFPNIALATIPVNVNLVAGTYWVGVIPVMDFTNAAGGTNGQLGIEQSIFGAGFPNGSNGFQVNPNGGFAFSGNQSALSQNLAYRLTAAPVPEPMSMTAIAMGLGALAVRRRRNRR